MYKIKLNQIREILGMEVSLEKIILMDGTELTTEKIEVGYPVFDSENYAFPSIADSEFY